MLFFFKALSCHLWWNSCPHVHPGFKCCNSYRWSEHFYISMDVSHELFFCIGHSLVVSAGLFVSWLPFLPHPAPFGIWKGKIKNCSNFYVSILCSFNKLFATNFDSFQAGIVSCITHLGSNSGVTHDILSLMILCSSSLWLYCHVMRNTTSFVIELFMLLMCSFLHRNPLKKKRVGRRRKLMQWSPVAKYMPILQG